MTDKKAKGSLAKMAREQWKKGRSGSNDKKKNIPGSEAENHVKPEDSSFSGLEEIYRRSYRKPEDLGLFFVD